MAEVPLFRIKVNGEMVAEAMLTVHDEKRAWNAFLNGFPQISHLVSGELFETMRLACDPELRAQTKIDQAGILLDLQG